MTTMLIDWVQVLRPTIIIIIIIIIILSLMDVAVSTSDLHAGNLLTENTSAEMSPVARQTNADKLGSQKPEE